MSTQKETQKKTEVEQQNFHVRKTVLSGAMLIYFVTYRILALVACSRKHNLIPSSQPLLCQNLRERAGSKQYLFPSHRSFL